MAGQVRVDIAGAARNTRHFPYESVHMSSSRRDEIEALLTRSGIAPTAQRVEIADIMLSQYQHLSAEQVLQRCNQTGPGVSKATVYNTLGLFAEHGIVRQVVVDPSKIFYDSNTTPHYHFYNVDDGTLTDIQAEQLPIGAIPKAPSGTVATWIDVIVRVKHALF
jgi:Fur family transcriptional regulator, iron response regulator